jgi:putative transport protein
MRMIDLLVDQPILLLVVVAVLGYGLGQISIKGSRLGVAGVMFAGLAIGALDPALKLPEFTTMLGLILFVYAIGISSGPSFFAALRRKGLRDTLLVVGVLAGAAAGTAGLAWGLGLAPPTAGGLFAGSLTNTPALAALLERVQEAAPPELLETMRSQPVVGYSIAYPFGVVGVMIAMAVARRLWARRPEPAADPAATGHEVGEDLASYSIRVTQPAVDGTTPKELLEVHDWNVRFGRLRRNGDAQQLVAPDTALQVDDVVSVVGEREAVAPVIDELGRPAGEQLDASRADYDFRRVFVSNADVTGRPLRTLPFLRRMDARVTRVRRGDVEWLASDDTVLEPGDQVRVVARPDEMDAVCDHFGDSYHALSRVNLLTLNLGLIAGVLLGLVPVPLPGGVTFHLGLAGGPLVAGLVLGTLGRTGPLVWYQPYNANHVLRQLGLVLFFAGVGTRAGYAFFDTLLTGGGLVLLGAGAALTLATAGTALWIGSALLNIPRERLLGMVAGLHTQPAVLAFATEQTGSDRPNLGYATVFPVAIIAKIVLAQLLFLML